MSRTSRRTMLKTTGAAALALPLARASAVAATGVPRQPLNEASDTPKISLEAGGAIGGTADEASSAARRIRQLGVDHVLSGGGRIPWDEARLKEMMASLKANGLTLANLMIAGFPNAIYNRPGKDQDIDNVIRVDPRRRHRRLTGRRIQLVRAPRHGRLLRRDWPGWRRMDRLRLRAYEGACRPCREEGAHTLDEMWTNITYFLKAVVPEAEKAGVRLALHPNDPPAPISRGSQQIMGSIDGWKKLIAIVDSPSNGITFDCGVTREMGGDPVEVCRYFASATGSTTCISATSRCRSRTNATPRSSSTRARTTCSP